MKFSVGLTFLALVILLLIPQSVYQLIFSTAFGEIKIILMALSAGVLALSANTIFSHFFSGIGQPKVNVYANAMGLIFTLLLLFILIPLWGIVGAAIAASVSYTITVIYQAIVFKRQTQTKWIEWIPKTDDFTEFVLLTKQILLTNETNEDK
jgi:O-antigen/teichoic acid export membrane protein